MTVETDPITLACPNCGSANLAEVSSYIGVCSGTYYVPPGSDDVLFEGGGETKINWDSDKPESDPAYCLDCTWEGKPADLVEEQEDTEDGEDDDGCEDCSVNGLECQAHGEAYRLAMRAVLDNPTRVISSLAWAKEEG